MDLAKVGGADVDQLPRDRGSEAIKFRLSRVARRCPAAVDKVNVEAVLAQWAGCVIPIARQELGMP